MRLSHGSGEPRVVPDPYPPTLPHQDLLAWAPSAVLGIAGVYHPPRVEFEYALVIAVGEPGETDEITKPLANQLPYLSIE